VPLKLGLCFRPYAAAQTPITAKGSSLGRLFGPYLTFAKSS
jgi:hypothetical protein